jgi:hypothetical protein
MKQFSVLLTQIPKHQCRISRNTKSGISPIALDRQRSLEQLKKKWLFKLLTNPFQFWKQRLFLSHKTSV